MIYCVKQENGNICSGTASTISVTNVAANEASVSICWVGVITEDDGCNKCESEQTFCELIYIGENTSTTQRPPIEGSIIWHDITIPYSITQNGSTVEPDCGSATTTSCVTDNYNVWVSPYIITKEEGGHDIKFYAEYSVETKDACGNVINTERITSSGCPISDSEGLSAKTDFENAIINKRCSDTDRTISASCRLMDIVPCLTSDSAKTVSATCYLAEEEHCCENESGICYEIGEVTYSPSSVPFSGGNVYYSFDYKKKTTINCVTNTKIGTYTSPSPWFISGRTEGEEGQCQRKQVTSSITPNLDDFVTCTNPSSTVNLSIWQGKNTTACTEDTCDESIGYCIDKSSIKQYVYTSNGIWEYKGNKDYQCNFLTYGGQLKVTWEYSAITIYDDCSSAVTSGNTWEDIKQISPCDECYDEGSSDTAITASIEYVFKSAFSGCTNGNKFTITYTQEKSKCVQDCPSCMGDGAITLDCGYSASTDELTGEVIYGDYISGVTAVSSETHCNVVSAISETICDWLLIDKSGNYYVYSANTANSGSSRTCTVSFDLGKIGNVPCTETVTVTQLGSGAEQDPSDPEEPIVCPCKYADGLFVGVYSLGKIPYKGGSPLDVASFGYGGCVSSFTIDMKEGVDWFHDSGITSAETEGEVEGALSGSVDCNCDCDHERTFELEYTYAASGCSGESGTTIITQSKNTNCNCNKITAATAGNIDSSGGNDIIIGTYQVSNDCPPTAVTTSTTASFINDINLSNTNPLANGNIKANVECNYCNSSSRIGEVTLTYQIGSKTCNASFLVTQEAGASATLTPSLISSTGGNVVTLATYSISGEQPDTITPSVSDESFIHDVGITSNNKISGSVDCNYCNSTSRTNVVTLKYSKDGCECEKTCIITQQGGTSITLSAGNDIPSTGGTVTLASYEISGSIPLHINASSSDNFIDPNSIGVDETNKTVTGTVSSNYCNSTSRGATITLTYYNVQSCSCTRTCNVTQVAGTAAVLVPSDEIACVGGSNITLATYIITGDNPDTVTATTNNSDFVITSCADGVIKGTVSENCCNELSRDCIITLTYSKGSESCSKTCEITQKGSANDKQITCTDENYTPVSECPDIETTSGGTLYLKLTDI